MYAESRAATPVDEHDVATTPSFWAANFAGYGKLSVYQYLALLTDLRWRILKRLVPPGGKVLEAGSGIGQWVDFLNRRGMCAVGLDYSADLVEQCRKMYPKYEFYHGDIRKMDLPSNSFAGLVSWGVVEHLVEGPQAALSEFLRVLEPGGVAIITLPEDTPRHRHASQLIFDYPGKSPANSAFFQYFMTQAELTELVRQAGFEIIETGVHGRACLALGFPRLYSKVAGNSALFRICNTLAYLLVGWRKDCRGSVHCVARKPRD